jgi:hypothetical protein
MHNYTPSINESFNARTTDTDVLCESFIVNEYYEQLASPDNTIMIGPRGSGKTTLMRMLEVKSLELWNKEQAKAFRQSIKFSGVFIPTDRLWKTQYDTAKNAIKNREDTLVLESQFIYHILEQLTQTLSFRISRVIEKQHNFRTANLSKEDESELVESLIDIWKVTPKIKSIKSLIIALALKKNQVSSYIASINSGTGSYIRPEVIQIPLTDVLGVSVSIINTLLEENGAKWTFLFDELELAPNELIQPLIDNMRGGNKDIIYKLALSPYHRGVKITETPESSMKDQDLKFINLTGISEQDGIKFSKELCSNILIKKGVFHKLENCFEKPQDLDVDAIFLALSDKDKSFKDYIVNKSIYSIKYSDAGHKQPQYRKIKFIAHLRNYHKKDASRRQKRRRASDYYAGFDNICKTVEYNPRMLIGIMNNFIPIIKDRKRVTISEQIDCIKSYFESFKALLSTIAIESSNDKFNTIYDLVEVIANFFQMEVHSQDFKSEPKGSLTFKKDSDIDLLEAIGCALNSGAMIAVKTNIGDFHDVVNVKTTRCRLSYLFSHHFGLLLTTQKDIELNDLISSSSLLGSKINLINPSGLKINNQLKLDWT